MTLTFAQVTKHFDGFNQVYDREYAKYKRIVDNKRTYSDEYLREAKQAFLSTMQAEKQERVQKAIADIEEYRRNYTKKNFVNPYHQIDKQVITTEDKLLMEMQRDKQMKLLDKRMELAEGSSDFQALLDEYGQDEFFHDYIRATVDQRIKKEGESGYIQLLNNEQIPPQVDSELTRMESTLRTVGNTEYYPAGIEGATSFSDLDFRPMVTG